MPDPILSFNPSGQDVLREKPDPMLEPAEVQDPSRTAKVANKVLSEWLIFSTARRPDELKWLKYLRNFNGVYDPTIKFDEDSSDLFVQMTRKEVSKAIGKIKQINDPTLEEPWDILPSDKPFSQFIDKNDTAEFKRRAMNMRQRFKDNFEAMRWDMLMDLSYIDYALFGTFVFHGPIGMPPPPTKWALAPQGDSNAGLSNAQQPSYIRLIDPDDAIRPTFERIRLFDFYPDPDAERIEDCNAVIVRQIYNKSQLRQLLKAKGFMKEEILAVLKEMPNGNWTPTMLEREVNVADEKRQPQSPSVTQRYEVLKRWGMLSGRDLQDIGIEVSDDDFETEFMYSCWVINNHVIRAQRSTFHADRLPFYVTPYEKQPGKLFGRGVAEMIEDSQRALNSIGRAMMDNLAFGSGPQGMVDIDAVPKGFNINKIGPRKMWPYRRGEFNQAGKPVDFFVVPTVLDQLIPAFKLFMDLIPQETSLPDYEPKNAGSGMRTDGSFQMYWEMSENFIKQTIGNISNYFWIPALSKMYDWEMLYNPDMNIKGDFQVVVRGPKGAIRREMVKTRLQEISQLMNNPSLGRRVDGAALTQGLLDHLDLGIENVFLTEEQALQREQQQKQMEAESAASGEAMKEELTANVRSEMSRRDALVKLATVIPPESPVWAPAIEQAYEILHSATPQLYAALSAHLVRVAAEAEAAGLNPKEVQALRMPPGPEAPTDLDPEYRQQLPALQAMQGQIAQEGLQPNGEPEPVGDQSMTTPRPIPRKHKINRTDDGGYELQVS